MADLVVYHYPKCSTCTTALRWLKQRNVDVRVIDITVEPPSAARLREIAALAKVPVTKLFNTSGVSYREGGFKDKLGHMNEAEMLAALANDGKLIKRPLVVGTNFALVGFAADSYAQALASR